MKATQFRIAVAAAVTLAGAACAVPAVPAALTPRADAPPDIEERPAPPSVFTGTAIGAVLEANDNLVPRSGEEMMRVLAKFGELAQLPVTFSAVDGSTGLEKPRVVITPKVSMTAPQQTVFKPQLGANALVLPDQIGPVPAQSPVSTTALTRPSLEGRLFLAANMEPLDGKLKVKTFEFISWNSRKQRFDFGFIECHEKEPQIRVVDGVKCFSCHKNRGPILGQGPWSNSTHNDMVRAAVALKRNVDFRKIPAQETLGQPRRLDTGFGHDVTPTPGATADGISVFIPQGPAVDAAVRRGADLARDRDIYRQLIRSGDGRRTFTLLLNLIVTPGNLRQQNDTAKPLINRELAASYSTFAEKVHAIRKANPDVLHDVGPGGSQGSLQSVATGAPAGWGSDSTLSSQHVVVWSGSTDLVTQFDTSRARGEQSLTSQRQPSNPKAFVPPENKLQPTPAAAVNAVALARLIGLTEADRLFFFDKLSEASQQPPKRTTPQTLAKEVFAQPPFTDLLAAGEIPDREDFKDRFVQGLNSALKARGAKELLIARSVYASGPNVAPVPGNEMPELVAVATTACVRCHDIRNPNAKPSFSPIPALAFDPFDQQSREAWVKATPAKERAAVLARLAKRTLDDRDMPPEDSAEYAQFRTKEPESFAAVKTWLEAELLKVK